MITPNRYHLWAALECHAFSKAEAVLRFSAEEDGMWVQWQDYARLKAEVERLTNCKAEADYLKAEVERLRLAGDTMAQRYLSAYQIDLRNGPRTPQSVVEWNAAKEGKQP